MADSLHCPHCGAVVDEIIVSHSYVIARSDEQEKWTKHIGGVVYSCCHCGGEIDIVDIADILKQVDEL